MPLFSNRQRQRLSRSGISYIPDKYVRMARTERRIPNRVSPHIFRHSKAMHLLQAGNPDVIIRDILGHVDVKTTAIYARADLELKRAALEKTEQPPPKLLFWQKDKDLIDWLDGL